MTMNEAKNNNYIKLNIILIISLLIIFVFSLNIGKAFINWHDYFNDGTKHIATQIIINEIRLPRTIIAMMCGGGLAICGAALQGFLRNPLADSGLLGISSFASLGAVIAIYFGLSVISYWILPSLAILFAAFSMLILLLITKNNPSIISFILTGVILSALSGGLLQLAVTMAPDPFAASEIINWQIGSFTSASMKDVSFMLPFMIIGIFILMQTGRNLDALALGEETAMTMGINLNSLKIMIVLGVGLIIGSATATSGSISFVGLIVPHLMRPFVNSRPSLVLLPSLIFGAAFTLLADVIVRILPFQNELKIGVIMTLLGAPFFFVLMKKIKNSGDYR